MRGAVTCSVWALCRWKVLHQCSLNGCFTPFIFKSLKGDSAFHLQLELELEIIRVPSRRGTGV